MFSQQIQPTSEEKINIKEFHVLNNGVFIKAHHKKLEILRGVSREFIEIKEAPDSVTTAITIIELSNQHVVLAYYDDSYNKSKLIIVDLKNGTCVASKEMGKIDSLVKLPDDTLLLNSKWICSYQDNNIFLDNAPDFTDFLLILTIFHYPINPAIFTTPITINRLSKSLQMNLKKRLVCN